MDSASTNPPMNRNMSSWPYGAAASRMVAAPVTGSNASGSRAVAYTGIASVIHHSAIHTAAAAVTRPA